MDRNSGGAHAYKIVIMINRYLLANDRFKADWNSGPQLYSVAKTKMRTLRKEFRHLEHVEIVTRKGNRRHLWSPRTP